MMDLHGISQVWSFDGMLSVLLSHLQDENTQAMQGIVYPFESCREQTLEIKFLFSFLLRW